MKNPTHNGRYTAADLARYASWRARNQLKDMTGIMEAQRKGKVEELEDHEDHRTPLEVAEHRLITVRLSWGGDGDGFKVVIDQDRTAISGVYFWEDWGVYEEVALSSEELDLVFNYYCLEAITA